jgi:hypothetical protein
MFDTLRADGFPAGKSKRFMQAKNPAFRAGCTGAFHLRIRGLNF